MTEDPAEQAVAAIVEGCDAADQYGGLRSCIELPVKTWRALLARLTLPAGASIDLEPACSEVSSAGFGKPIVLCTRTGKHRDHSGKMANGQVLLWR